jgi:hypothetical protein
VTAEREVRSVDVALAEFNALRAEIISHVNAQYALIGVGLTALGLIFSFVIKDHGNRHLLLIVPPLAFLFSLLHAGATYRQLRLGRYIRNQLWPYVQSYTDATPSWESYIEPLRHGRGVVVDSVLTDGPPTALFLIASVAATIAAPNVDPLGRAAEWSVTALTVAAPIVIAFLGSRVSESRERGAALHPDAGPQP